MEFKVAGGPFSSCRSLSLKVSAQLFRLRTGHYSTEGGKEKPGVIAQFTPASLRTVSYCQLPTMNQILAQGEKARLSVPTREVR